jgi:hypothetical protein
MTLVENLCILVLLPNSGVTMYCYGNDAVCCALLVLSFSHHPIMFYKRSILLNIYQQPLDTKKPCNIVVKFTVGN